MTPMTITTSGRNWLRVDVPDQALEGLMARMAKRTKRVVVDAICSVGGVFFRRCGFSGEADGVCGGEEEEEKEGEASSAGFFY